MSPLQTGPNSFRPNITELMKPPVSQARKKAITTIMKKHNMSRSEAQLHQAKTIAQVQMRKS